MLEFFIFHGISALLYLGDFAERSLGVPRYIFVYLISGITGALLHGIVASYVLGNGNIVLIGASGAISGVL
jgi:rhomboid protease GluP